ncbi:MAG: hypothetical protein ACOYMZ_01230 [Minisyncoccia bacterium]
MEKLVTRIFSVQGPVKYTIAMLILLLVSNISYSQPMLASAVEAVTVSTKTTKAPGIYGEELYVTESGVEIKKGQEVKLIKASLGWGFKSIANYDIIFKKPADKSHLLAKYEDYKAVIEDIKEYKSAPGIAYAKIRINSLQYVIRIEMALREKEVEFL